MKIYLQRNVLVKTEKQNLKHIAGTVLKILTSMQKEAQTEAYFCIDNLGGKQVIFDSVTQNVS